jgi:hypothetical protein
MTVLEHIDKVRMILKQTSDDTHYTNEFIYKLLVDARAHIIEQKLRKKHKISAQNYQTFCIQLEPATYHDCGTCIPDVSCRILKGTVKLPRVLRNKYRDFMKILTTTGETEIAEANGIYYSLLKHSNTRKNDWMYELVNRKPIVWGPSALEYLVVQAILEDPTEVADMDLCDVSGSDCYNPATDDFPMAADINNPVYEIIVRQLAMSIQLADDLTNNAESTENGRQKTNARK